jgi:6-phosphogluconolactonase (cycloisomerase 2 family)
VFSLKSDGIALAEVVDSGGIRPISLTVHDRTLYVLNAGGSGNISGFRVRSNGRLSALEGSTQPLSNGGVGDAPGPAQISFSPDGDLLVVTEKATNLIDIYQLDEAIAGPPVTHPSAGQTPFGFAFGKRDQLIVSEAFGGASGASALSSYQLEEDAFEVISPSVATPSVSQ